VKRNDLAKDFSFSFFLSIFDLFIDFFQFISSFFKLLGEFLGIDRRFKEPEVYEGYEVACVNFSVRVNKEFILFFCLL
jgi:hypothetical protein